MKMMLAVMMLSIGGSAMAQQALIDKMKMQRKVQKAANEMLDTEVSKSARELAKSDKKEGWKVAPGLLPLEQQYNKSQLLQQMTEDDGLTPQYVWGDATSTGENYDGAKMQALELALLNMVSSIEKNVTQIVDNNRNNVQGAAGTATTVVKSLAKGKSYVSQHVGQTSTIVDTYKVLPNGNVQSHVVIFYSMDKAREVARDAIRKQLEQEGQGNAVSDGDLDKLLGQE